MPLVCPRCGFEHSHVTHVYRRQHTYVVIRRRRCLDCGARFKTRERSEFTTEPRGIPPEIDPASFDPPDEDEPIQPDAAPLRFEEAVDRYISARLERGHGRRSYRYLFRLWRSEFTGRPITEIAPGEIADALATWRTERNWSPATRNNCLQQLSGFLSFALRANWIYWHPILNGGLEVELRHARGPAEVENESDREQVWDGDP